MNPKTKLQVDIVVEPWSSMLTCTACNGIMPLSNKARENPLYCPHCGMALVITDYDGNALNTHWAALASSLAREIGNKFGVQRFRTKSMSTQWELVEHHYDAADIRRVSDGVFAQYPNCGSSCFSIIAQGVAGRKLANSGVADPQASTVLTDLMNQEISDGVD
jgi:predicted RNA-binding Zn-ribbon protein involved in translation (DUF1610 family)